MTAPRYARAAFDFAQAREGRALRPVTETDWANIERALSLGQSSPLFYQLYFDGIEHLDSGDLRRAVIDFAIACEVLLKTLLERRLPPTLFDAPQEILAPRAS